MTCNEHFLESHLGNTESTDSKVLYNFNLQSVSINYISWCSNKVNVINTQQEQNSKQQKGQSSLPEEILQTKRERNTSRLTKMADHQVYSTKHRNRFGVIQMLPWMLIHPVPSTRKGAEVCEGPGPSCHSRWPMRVLHLQAWLWQGRAMCCFDMPSPSEVEAAGGCSFTLQRGSRWTLLVWLNFKERERGKGDIQHTQTVWCLSWRWSYGVGRGRGGQRGRSYLCLTPDISAGSARVQAPCGSCGWYRSGSSPSNVRAVRWGGWRTDGSCFPELVLTRFVVLNLSVGQIHIVNTFRSVRLLIWNEFTPLRYDMIDVHIK